MKKVMFTAIAMIAFVGSSMGNTIEFEKANLLFEEKSCQEKAMDYLEARDPNNLLTGEQLHEIYTAFLSGCAAGETKKNISQSVQP